MNGRRRFIGGGAATGLVCAVQTLRAPLGHAASPAVGAVEAVFTVFRNKRRRRTHEEVVFHLAGVPGAKTQEFSKIEEIRQKDRKFVPEVLAVIKGTTLSFPNLDRIPHNVYSQSEAGKFDLGVYPQDGNALYRTKKAGEIRVRCNMHAEMRATVLVLETNFFGMSGKSGRVSIPNVPPGSYRWHAWIAYGESVEGEVTVHGGETARVSGRLLETWPPPDVRKDGSLYEEY